MGATVVTHPITYLLVLPLVVAYLVAENYPGVTLAHSQRLTAQTVSFL